MSPEERLDELEIRYSFQAHTIEVLDGVIRELHERLARLERRIEELEAANADPEGEVAPMEEQVPPHY